MSNPSIRVERCRGSPTLQTVVKDQSNISLTLTSPLWDVKERRVPAKEENEHMDLEVTPLDKVASRTSRALRPEAVAPYLFLLPFVALFTLFFIVPIFYALYQSLFRSERNGLGLGAATVSFNGLGNYLDVLRDPNFYS
ncbi:MAG: hypothetical protein ACJ797_15915, partial [Ktedonobacteraceae bacterium]